MRRISFIFVFVMTFLFQHSIAQDWVKTYPAWPVAHGRWLMEDYDKGYLLLLDPYLNGNYYYSVIVKTDINGSQLWAMTIGDGMHVFLQDNIEQTLDHGLIVCGMTNKYDSPAVDPFLIKLNSCGELEWCKVISTPGIYDYSIRIKQTLNGEYILLAAYSDPNDLYRIQLYKLDPTGEWI